MSPPTCERERETALQKNRVLASAKSLYLYKIYRWRDRMLRPKRNDEPVLLNLPKHIVEQVDLAVREQGVSRLHFLRSRSPNRPHVSGAVGTVDNRFSSHPASLRTRPNSDGWRGSRHGSRARRDSDSILRQAVERNLSHYQRCERALFAHIYQQGTSYGVNFRALR